VGPRIKATPSMKRRLVVNREFVVRAAISLAAVALVHVCSWQELRSLVTRIVVDVSRLLGLEVARGGDTEFLSGATRIRVELRCTLIQAYALMAPLLWDRYRTLGWNLRLQLTVAVTLIAAACFRIVVSVAVFSAGIDWTIGHSVVCATMEFCAFLFVFARQPWDRDAGRARDCAKSVNAYAAVHL